MDSPYAHTVNGDAMNPVIDLPQPKRLLEQVGEVLRYKHYSLKTEQAYVYFVFAFSSGGAGTAGRCDILATWAPRK
ncbi:hypothetical protein GALL_303070 [mine drainage metagenome]|uniref:Uncharacterized protein n=1 Tax=mine drainage metagenome TaxID=410659 RepID=A0A1J5QWB3_9ZZZZ